MDLSRLQSAYKGARAIEGNPWEYKDGVCLIPDGVPFELVKSVAERPKNIRIKGDLLLRRRHQWTEEDRFNFWYWLWSQSYTGKAVHWDKKSFRIFFDNDKDSFVDTVVNGIANVKKGAITFYSNKNIL